MIELNDPGNRLQFNNTNFQWEGPASPSPLFGVKKEEMTEGRKASRESKSKPGPPLSSVLAQGLDPLLHPASNFDVEHLKLRFDWYITENIPQWIVQYHSTF